jgi:hypothetical protein
VPVGDVLPCRKKKQQKSMAAHLAAHVLERVAQAHHEFHTEMNKKRSAKALRRNASDVTREDKPGVSAGCPEGGPGVPEGGLGVSDKVNVQKLITVQGNSAKGTLFPVRTLDYDDSDTEACGGDAVSLDPNVLGKRNTATQEKYALAIKASQAPCDPGNGVFAVKALAAGAELPVKGPLFDSIVDVEAWLAGQPAITARHTALKVVELNFEGTDAGKGPVASPKYKVMSQLLGFLNDFKGIANRPNAVLQWKADRPTSQKSLVCKLLTNIEADKEIVINYGAKHPVGGVRGRKAAVRRKVPGVEADSEAAPAQKKHRFGTRSGR